jgi:hypothetical protein
MFDYKISVFNKKRKEFCYAGDWTCYLNLANGNLKACYRCKSSQNIYHDIDKPIIFKPLGNNCSLAHCYNAHAWLTFGAIPEHKSPCYNVVRDRLCTDGTHWVNDEMRECFESKLCNQNRRLNFFERLLVNIKYRLKYPKVKLSDVFEVSNIKDSTGEKTHKLIKLVGIKIKFKRKHKYKKIQDCGSSSIDRKLDEIKILNEVVRLDEFAKAIAPTDQMIFICINGIGDSMLYASYWRELEEMYNTKIFWIVNKSHEIVLKMYGITNYVALDYIGAHKKGKFSGALNVTTTPVKNIPYYAHWTYNMATRVGKKYFLDFVRDAMNLQQKPFNHPIWYPEISENLKAKISTIQDLNKTVLISPDARFLPLKNDSLWNNIASELTNLGYEIILNDFLHQTVFDKSYCAPKLSTEDLVALSKNCLATISPRSGFTDIMHELGDRLFVLYTSESMLQLYTLNKLCSTKNVCEFVVCKDFSPKYIAYSVDKLYKEQIKCEKKEK